jgi:hypothetical protein
MNASSPEDPADETRVDDATPGMDDATPGMDDATRADDVAIVDDVASVVGEVSESAEQESPSRPVTDVARSALARVRRGGAAVGRGGAAVGRGGAAVGQRGTSLARRAPGAGLARRGAETGKRLAGRGSGAAGRGSGVVARAPRAAGHGMRFGGRWLAHEVVMLAPRLPVRDRDKLQAQFPGKTSDEVAEALIEGASRASAAVGATIGVWAVLPIAPAFPAEIVTETLTLVGIEIKLIAELHEVYDMRPAGDLPGRMTAYVGAWANRRGVSLTPGGVVLALGSPLARRLQRRLAGRAGRSAVSLGPLLTGAAAGALLNRRETRRLGHEIRDDLRKRFSGESGWLREFPPGPAEPPGWTG